MANDRTAVFFNSYGRDEIVNSPFNWKEKSVLLGSRSRKAFHVYYSNVAYELAGRSREDQGIILGTQLHDKDDNDDDDINIRNRVIAMWNDLPQDSKAL